MDAGLMLVLAATAAAALLALHLGLAALEQVERLGRIVEGLKPPPGWPGPEPILDLDEPFDPSVN